MSHLAIILSPSPPPHEVRKLLATEIEAFRNVSYEIDDHGLTILAAIVIQRLQERTRL